MIYISLHEPWTSFQILDEHLVNFFLYDCWGLLQIAKYGTLELEDGYSRLNGPSRSLSRSMSWSRSLSLLRSLSRSRSWSLSLSLPLSLSLSRSLSLSLSRSLSGSRSRSLSLSLSISRLDDMPLPSSSSRYRSRELTKLQEHTGEMMLHSTFSVLNSVFLLIVHGF